MLLSTSFLFFYLLFTVIFLNLNCLFLFHFNISSNIISLVNRICLNDFYFINYYFLWTSLWFIPFYILIILILFHYNVNSLNIKKKSSFIIITVLILITYLSYLNCNLVYLNLKVFSEDTNALLLNSVNKIHPLLLYISLLVFFLILVQYYNIDFNFLQKNEILMFNSVSSIKYKVVLSIYTLYLGGWWALQEGSWGGWWNWDFSEVFGLFILYKLLVVIHSKFYLRSCYMNRNYFSISCILLLIFYLSIQLNFSYVSHNFGFRFYKFINTTILFNYLLLITITCLIFFQNEFYLIIINSSSKLIILRKRLISLIFILTSLILYLSLLILLNDFLWTNFNLNLFNFQCNFNDLIFIIVHLLILYVFEFKFIIIFLMLVLNEVFINFIFLVLNRLKFFTLIILLHYIFLIIFFYSISYYEEVLSNLTFIQSDNNFTNGLELVVNELNLENLSNRIEETTTFSGKYFDLNLYEKFVLQKFYPLGYKELFNLTIFDNQVLFIYVNFILSLYLLLYKINKKFMV